jgi:hypothetical protein
MMTVFPADISTMAWIKSVHDDSFSKAWFDALPGIQREQIHKHYGQFPTMEDDFTLYTNGFTIFFFYCSCIVSPV